MKRVESIDPSTSAHEVLATFMLVGDDLRADYRDRDYQLDVEVNGIYSMKTGEVKPSDGRRFYDALDEAYRNSSFVQVVTEA